MIVRDVFRTELADGKRRALSSFRPSLFGQSKKRSQSRQLALSDFTYCLSSAM